MLIKEYYTIEHTTASDDGAMLFHVRLNPACDVYRGHFPEKAVSPGVCNIQMVKECAEQVAGQPLMLTNLQLCRLTTLVTPTEHPLLDVHINLTRKEEAYLLKATVGHDGESYLELKAELSDELQATRDK